LSFFHFVPKGFLRGRDFAGMVYAFFAPKVRAEGIIVGKALFGKPFQGDLRSEAHRRTDF